MSRDRPRFSREAFWAGIRRSVPMLISAVPFGLVVGVLAQGHGLSWAEAALMSAACFAGSAQILSLSQWAVPAPILAVTFASLVVNLRLVLMGPTMQPWLDRVQGWRRWGTLFLMADQNWALSVTEMRSGKGDAAFLFGSGAVMWLVWLLSTVAGYALGSTMRPPPGHPLFFTAIAVFVAMLALLWRGKRDMLPWVVAGLVALVISRLVPGTWYIVAGALAGSAAAVVRDRRAGRP